MMKKLLTVLMTIAISLSAMAEVPSLINYQGQLKSKFGSWINDTPNFTLKVFDQSTGGNLLYEEEIGQVSVVDGAYSFNFGANGISNIPTSELIATADGEKQIFNYTTRFKPIVGNVKISGGGYSWTDDGSSSPSKFTATINKTTGSVSAIYITKAPKVGTEITIEYNKRGITEALSKSGQTWLELTVGEETLSPRERLVAVPFAMKARYAEEVQNQPLIPIYIFKDITIRSPTDWATNEDNFSIEKRLYFKPSGSQHVSVVYPGFKDYGPHIYIPKNTKYLEINLLDKTSKNILLRPGEIFRDLSFSIECTHTTSKKKFFIKKLSYNKYAISDPPSGMCSTYFRAMGQTEAQHMIEFTTDIVISIK